MLKYLFISLLIWLVINLPIGYALGVSSAVAVVLGSATPGIVVAQRIFASMNSFPLLAIPYFMVAGAVMELGGVSKRIINLASAIVGHRKGGVANAAIISCAIVAAISGSTPATAAAIGSICVPEMVKRKYPADYSSAGVASSACLGVIIPPSITMVIFASTTGTSIGRVLIGGIIPGIILALMLCITNTIFCRKAGYETEPKQNGKEVWEAFKDAVWARLMPVIILGGIYSGKFTPTEAAAVSCVYTFIIGTFVYKEIRWKEFVDCMKDTVVIAGATSFIVGMSTSFAYVMTLEQVPETLSAFILGLSSNKIVVLLIMNVFLLIVGMFMDNISSCTILAPILLPVATALGVNPVHFGILMTMNLAVGFITPPYGVNLFVGSSVARIPFERVVKWIWPLIGTILVVLLLTTYVPQLSLLLV